MNKFIYRFGTENEGSAKDVKLLGGKGANLAEMASLGMPIPPGFTITTEMCIAYNDSPDAASFLGKIMPSVKDRLQELEKHFGYMPLVSIRSGAPVSMPGMMDTILMWA